MSIELISLGAVAISLIAAGVIVVRKFPLLARTEAITATTAVEARKRSLLEQRLRRKVTTAWEAVSTAAGPIGQRVQNVWQGTHQKLVELEREYKIRSLPVFLNRRQRHKLDREISDLLTQARALGDDGEDAAAEEKAMQAIRLEPRSVPAFEFLGELYLKTNQPDHAKEVYRYLLKLVGESDAIYEHLGEAELASGDLREAEHDLERAVQLNGGDTVYYLNLAKVDRMLGEWRLAFERIEEAHRREPNNPKILDEYIEISIGAGKKQFAEDAVRQMSDVNPENSKIASWREQIEAMENSVKFPAVTVDESSPTLYETHTSPNERT